jgi:hypothetical protein
MSSYREEEIDGYIVDDINIDGNADADCVNDDAAADDAANDDDDYNMMLDDDCVEYDAAISVVLDDDHNYKDDGYDSKCW